MMVFMTCSDKLTKGILQNLVLDPKPWDLDLRSALFSIARNLVIIIIIHRNWLGYLGLDIRKDAVSREPAKGIGWIMIDVVEEDVESGLC